MRVKLSSGQVIYVHDEGTCYGPHCALHNPSDHFYKNHMLYFNARVGVWERILDNGETIPDPDNLGFRHNRVLIYENKIECIECGDLIESTHRHDYVTCACTAVAVDGGREYLRRVGENFVERSVLKENPVYA